MKTGYSKLNLPNMKTKNALPFFVLLIMTIWSSCSQQDEMIVGKWVWQDGSTSQYLENGIVVGKDWSGSWEINENKLILKQEFGKIRAFEIKELTQERLVLIHIPTGKMEIGIRTE